MALEEAEADQQHQTSLAVWDLACPVVIGRSVRMKVGVKCSAGCQLRDREIEIHDQTGAVVARAALGSEPWPGTSGLFWTELDFRVPAESGTHKWAVTSAHGNAFSNFDFIAVQPPDHTLTIRVTEKATHSPLQDVEIRLDAYRASSDAQGLTTIELPKGNYTLSVWKMGYEHFSTDFDVTDTRTIEVEIAVEPEPKQLYWM
jgi:hypothetical protein